jgi:hypothetical protein
MAMKKVAPNAASLLNKDTQTFLKGGMSDLISGIDLPPDILIPKKSEDFVQKVLKDTKGNLVVNEAIHNVMHRFLRIAKKKGFNKIAIGGGFGAGKSMISGTYVIMNDLTFKKVEDVVIGDKLLGPDSKPRKVLFLGNGKEQAYKITLRNGDSFGCNESHILPLIVTRDFYEYGVGDVLEIVLKDYLKLPKWVKQQCLKMFKVPLDFNYVATPEDPYEYGKNLGNFRLNHGDTNTQFYNLWMKMKERCDNTNIFGYKHYGGRGIKYEAKWAKYVDFKEDMYQKYCHEIKHNNIKFPSLERLDVDGDYTKDNCTFIEMKDQGKNTRRLRWFEATSPTGEKSIAKNQSEFARKIGLNEGKVRSCLCKGFTTIEGWSFRYLEEHEAKIEKSVKASKKIILNKKEEINKIYLKNSREVRMQVLAGFLDIHGAINQQNFRFITKSKSLRDDLLFLCRSLGFSVNHCEEIYSKTIFYRVTITGDTHLIPCKIKKIIYRKRMRENYLLYSFKVESIGEQEYFGFGLDKDKLYLQDDLTVHHNTENMCIGYSLYKIAMNPNILIKIVHVSDTEATKRCRSIRDYIERDEDFHEMAPHIQPTNIWGSERFTVNRTSPSANCTVEAYSVLGTGIGGRANIIIFDDPQDLRTTLYEPTTRVKIEDTIKNIWLTRIIPEDSEVILMMNKWTDSDMLSYVQRNPAWAWIMIALSVEKTHYIVTDSFGRNFKLPLWSKFNRAALDDRHITLGDRDFKRGYCLIPYTDSDKTFGFFERCCHFGVSPRAIIENESNWIFVGGIDFAGSKRPGTVLSIVAVHRKTGLKLPVEIVTIRKSSDLTGHIIRTYREYGVELYNAENNGVQEAIIDLLQAALGEEKFKKYNIKIEGFLTGRGKMDINTGLPSMDKEFENKEWLFGFKDGKPDVSDDMEHKPWSRMYFEMLNHPFYETSDIAMSLYFCREAVKKLIRGMDSGPNVF